DVSPTSMRLQLLRAMPLCWIATIPIRTRSTTVAWSGDTPPPELTCFGTMKRLVKPTAYRNTPAWTVWTRVPYTIRRRSEARRSDRCDKCALCLNLPAEAITILCISPHTFIDPSVRQITGPHRCHRLVGGMASVDAERFSARIDRAAAVVDRSSDSTI